MLPPELITHILGCVHADCFGAKGDLKSCSLVSYAWRELTLPFLFREVFFWYLAEDIVAAEEAAAKRSGLVPQTAGYLTSFLAFLRSRLQVAKAVRELRLQACHTSSKDGNVTDVAVFMGILQALPNLRILHVTDVHFEGPLDAISEAGRFMGYRPMSLEQLHYSNWVDESLSGLIFGSIKFINLSRVLWLVQLFRRIGELHVRQLEGICTESQRQIPALPCAPEVEKVIAHGAALYNTCEFVQGLDLRAIRHMDVGDIYAEDLGVLGDVLAGAVNLEHFLCGIHILSFTWFPFRRPCRRAPLFWEDQQPGPADDHDPHDRPRRIVYRSPDPHPTRDRSAIRASACKRIVYGPTRCDYSSYVYR
ncbi:hypothetical protein NM688_g3521 [Phlebia brevispora]|uniref:Uncharacterized protein n=1 Tax=Phlebia brevispora TaxID=194682 RepID=A0ACC1T5A7_9APHY|nr:hypothetical protein NM688_g3521 [Phlebia brevispora]